MRLNVSTMGSGVMAVSAALMAFMPLGSDGEDVAPIPPAFTPEISTRAIALLIDESSAFDAAEAMSANYARTALLQDVDPTRPIFLGKITGSPIPKNAFPEPFMVRGTPCPQGHILWRMAKGTNTPCSERGFKAHQERFETAINGAFEAGINQDVAGAHQSAIFEAIAHMAMIARQSDLHLDVLALLSDALPNSFVQYQADAPWLVEGPDRDELFHQLALRGLLPDLRGTVLAFTATGRPLADAERAAGVHLSTEENSTLESFWRAYAERTGAQLVWLGAFDPALITLQIGEG